MRGSVLAVHAFAEEMNKTRAAVADGARAIAAAGYAVLQIDLTGCGDSAGDFADATWAGWLDDLTAAWAWLDQRCEGQRWLWGTRLGALLAEQFASQCKPGTDGLLMWQPVVSGAQHLGQFLRLKTINMLLRENKANNVSVANAVSPTMAPSPRSDLADGRAVEIAGYQLTPMLADAIEAARMGTSASPPPRVRWFEISSQSAAGANSTLGPIATRLADRWRAAGSDVQQAMIVGSAFWQTQEVERCDALVDASVAALCT